MAGIFGMCSTVRAGPVSRSSSASSLHTTPSRLEFASWPDGAALPPPGHSFWKQAHAADVAIQAITSLQRDRHNLEVQLQSATGKAANERLQQTLNAVQDELADVRGKYEQLKQQRVAEVVDRVASKVSAEEEVRQSRGGGAAAAAASVALDDLRRTQHALLREREARLKVETEAQALRAKCADLEGALLVEQERVNDVSRQLLASISSATAAAAAHQQQPFSWSNGTAAPQAAVPPMVVGQAAAAEAAAAAASEAAAAAMAAAAAAAAMQSSSPREVMPVSAQRLGELEERLRQSDASRLAAEREAGFLRSRVKALDADAKAAKESELRAKSKVAVMQQTSRAVVSAEAFRSSGSEGLEAAKQEAAQAAARAEAAERAAGEASALIEQLSSTVEDLQRQLRSLRASQSQATADLASGAQQWNSAEGQLMAALDSRNAAIRECNAMNKRVKALESELQAAKKAAATRELKMQARVDALSTGR